MKKFMTLALLAAAGCTPGKPEPPPPPDDAAVDTRSVAAERMAAMIAAQERHVVKLGDDVLTPVGLARSADALREVEKVKELKDAFGKALTTVHVLEEATLYLSRELGHAEAAYQSGFDCFEARSRDYKDEKLRAACSSFASHYAALKGGVPAQRRRLDALRAELPGTLDTMRESGRMLDDYHLFVVNNPTAATSLTLTQRYVRAIKAYASKFESFEKALEVYRRETAPRPAAPRPAGEKVSLPTPEGRDAELALAVETADPGPVPVVVPVPVPTTGVTPTAQPTPEKKPESTPEKKPEPAPDQKPKPPAGRFPPAIPAATVGRPAGLLRTPSPAPYPGPRPSKPPAKYPGSARGR